MTFVVTSVKVIPTCNKITLKYAEKYFRTVMKWVNFSEEAHDKQRKKRRTGLIKVSILSNNRSKQIYPRLSCITFHKMAHMYIDIKKQQNCESIDTYSRPSCQLWVNQVCKEVIYNTHDIYATATNNSSRPNNSNNSTRIPWWHPALSITGFEFWWDRLFSQCIMDKSGLYL